MTNPQKLTAIVLLALLGFADAAWLTAQSLVTGLGGLCGPLGDCRQVLASPYGRVFGIPLSVFGLLMYTALLLSVHATAVVRERRTPVLLLRGVASLGVVGSAVLMYIQFVVLHAFCLFCTLSAIVMTALWVLSLMVPAEAARPETPAPSGSRVVWSAMAVVFVLGCGVLVFGVIGGRTPPAGIVARIGDEVITEQELNEGIRAFVSENQRQLQEARMQWLEERLSKRLLQKESERRGMSVLSLEEQTVGGITAVSDSEIVLLAKAWKADVKALTEQDRQYLHSLITTERKNIRLRSLIDSLKVRFGVTVYLRRPLAGYAEFDFTGSPRSGSDAAPVTIVVFVDFECVPCATVAGYLHDLRREYQDSLRIVVKNYPQEMHPDALLAAEAALCADEQGRFWAYHDVLFANQGKLGREKLVSYATEAGLDLERFTGSLESRKYQQLVIRDRDEGRTIGIEGTPTLFVNGLPVVGDITLDRLRAEIGAAMNTSGVASSVSGVQSPATPVR